MRTTTIDIDLDRKALTQSIKQLRAYRDDLIKRGEMFVSRLAAEGVTVAQGRMVDNKYQRYIRFESRVEVEGKAYIIGFVSGISDEMHTSYWYPSATAEEERSAVVNPILMAEFGSGLNANIHGYMAGSAASIAGRGTFPGQTHAYDPRGWFWYESGSADLGDQDTIVGAAANGRIKHHSYGEVPAAPMLTAKGRMWSAVERIARQVFGD